MTYWKDPYKRSTRHGYRVFYRSWRPPFTAQVQCESEGQNVECGSASARLLILFALSNRQARFRSIVNLIVLYIFPFLVKTVRCLACTVAHLVGGRWRCAVLTHKMFLTQCCSISAVLYCTAYAWWGLGEDVTWGWCVSGLWLSSSG